MRNYDVQINEHFALTHNKTKIRLIYLPSLGTYLSRNCFILFYLFIPVWQQVICVGLIVMECVVLVSEQYATSTCNSFNRKRERILPIIRFMFVWFVAFSGRLRLPEHVIHFYFIFIIKFQSNCYDYVQFRQSSATMRAQLFVLFGRTGRQRI